MYDHLHCSNKNVNRCYEQTTCIDSHINYLSQLPELILVLSQNPDNGLAPSE